MCDDDTYHKKWSSPDPRFGPREKEQPGPPPVLPRYVDIPLDKGLPTAEENRDARAWKALASCLGLNPEIFFITKHDTEAEVEVLRAMCRGCPVLEQCRAFRLAHPLEEVPFEAGFSENEWKEYRKAHRKGPAAVAKFMKGFGATEKRRAARVRRSQAVAERKAREREQDAVEAANPIHQSQQ